jgi:hypothetical protein
MPSRAPKRPRPGRTADRQTPAILERNLERYPWSRLSDDKGEQYELRVLLDSAGEEGRAWAVTTQDAARLPGPFDADTYVALGQLYNAAGRPEDRTIRVTFRELADLMHRPVGGGFYEALEASLHRLARVSITAVQTWRQGPDVAELKTFHLLSAETRHRRESGADSTVAVVRFSEDVAESIAAGNFRLLDAAEYFALEQPTAKRLYRYLDYRRWRGAERQPDFAISLAQLAAELPIDRSSPSHIKRTLDPAHAQLVSRGFLTAAEYEDRPVPGKKRPQVWVRYRFADPPISAPAPAAAAVHAPNAAREARRDPDHIRDTVAEILGTLRDEHSTAFYAKVAATLPDEILRNVLGGIREAIRDGVSLEAARKMFTAAVRSRAKAAGLAL